MKSKAKMHIESILECDEKESKIMENIDFSHFSNSAASFMGNPVFAYV